LEGGVLGVCIITCPSGKCTLTQGNYRAEVRVRTVKRLLEEIGSDPSRAKIVQCAEGQTPESMRESISEAIAEFSAMVQRH
jgi:coenzyme F420-reducing hydrogenase delta subunit